MTLNNPDSTLKSNDPFFSQLQGGHTNYETKTSAGNEYSAQKREEDEFVKAFAFMKPEKKQRKLI